MGADPRHLNLAQARRACDSGREVASTDLSFQLRSRALALHAKLDDFHRRLASTPCDSVSWAEVVSMFGVLNAQVASLAGKLRPACKHYVLHPQAATLASATPWWRESALPAMHSVRLETALEAEEAELCSRQVREAPPAHSAAFALDALQQRVEAHNKQLRAALELLQQMRGEQARERGRSQAHQKQDWPAPADAARLLAAAQFGEGLRKKR